MIFNYLFLGVILLVSLVICWEDIQHKKIRNKLILIGLLLGAILFGGSYFLGWINNYYLKVVFFNTVIAIVVSFLIWKMGFWPAGDSKYFILIAFLLPIHYYNKSYLEYFPSFILLVNIFILFVGIILVKVIYFNSRSFIIFSAKTNRGELKQKFFQVVNTLIVNMQNVSNWKKWGKGMLLGGMMYFILSFFIYKRSIDLVPFFIYSTAFGLFDVIFNFYNQSFAKKSIDIINLQPKMNLADEFPSDLKKDKERIEKIGKLRPDGLDKQQVRVIKEYYISKDLKQIYIYKTIPFSIWIFIGTVITIIFQRNIIQIIL